MYVIQNLLVIILFIKAIYFKKTTTSLGKLKLTSHWRFITSILAIQLIYFLTSGYLEYNIDFVDSAVYMICDTMRICLIIVVLYLLLKKTIPTYNFKEFRIFFLLLLIWGAVLLFVFIILNLDNRLGWDTIIITFEIPIERKNILFLDSIPLSDYIAWFIGENIYTISLIISGIFMIKKSNVLLENRG